MARNLNEVRVRQNYSNSKTSNTVSDEIKEILADIQDSLKQKNNGEKKPYNHENIVSEIGDAEVFDPLMQNPPNAFPFSTNSSGQKLLKLVTNPLIKRKEPEQPITGKLLLISFNCGYVYCSVLCDTCCTVRGPLFSKMSGYLQMNFDFVGLENMNEGSSSSEYSESTGNCKNSGKITDRPKSLEEGNYPSSTGMIFYLK